MVEVESVSKLFKSEVIKYCDKKKLYFSFQIKIKYIINQYYKRVLQTLKFITYFLLVIPAVCEDWELEGEALVNNVWGKLIFL